MNRARRLPPGKLSLVTVLSLGSMVLGIGCISWATFSIWTQSNCPADATGSRYSVPTTLAAELDTRTGDSTAPVGSDPPGVLYHAYPAEGDSIGSLTIPALKRRLPILQGTGAKELKKGVGHITQSVLPGEKDNCVVSGHRDTVFRKLGDLKIGDLLIVQTSAGTFTYEVNGTRIVHGDDRTVIVPTGYAVLTMTTCYPFNYIGHAPDRYIVSAALVNSEYAAKSIQDDVSMK